MKGIEISREYWLQCGKPAFEEEFPELMKYLAVGLIGSGSECFGFDDDISRDHDFGPGFCIFLPGEDLVDRRAEFQLERAYAKLPREFLGLEREKLNPVGGNRCGVFRTTEWYRGKTGIPGAPKGWQDFIALPDYALAEVTNGEVFFDTYGEFTAIRKAWQEPPRDYVQKKLCGALISMSQAGEYNYPRCLQRGDLAAAHLCADEFVKAAISAVFWSFGKPVPYYKWSFKALRELETGKGLPPVSTELESILFAENAAGPISEAGSRILSIICQTVLSGAESSGLQPAALELNSLIKDPGLRNLSPLAAI